MQKLVSNTPYHGCVYSESGVANLMLSKLLGLELEEAASGMVSTSEGGVAAAVAAFCDLSWAGREPAPTIPMESTGGPFRKKAENRGLVVDVFSGGDAPPSAGALRRLVIRILMGIGRRTGSCERPGGLAAGSSTGAAKDSSLTRARDSGDLARVLGKSMPPRMRGLERDGLTDLRMNESTEEYVVIVRDGGNSSLAPVGGLSSVIEVMASPSSLVGSAAPSSERPNLTTGNVSRIARVRPRARLCAPSPPSGPNAFPVRGP